MPRTRPPYTPEFRQQMIDLVRNGRDPQDLAREFEPSGQTIRNWVAQADRDEAHKAFDRTLKRFEAEYPKAMACLAKDRDELLAFYDYPAEHWVHIRTTNPIESTFATVRLRSKRSRNCGSCATTLAMVFKLLQSAKKRWKRIKGFSKLKLVVNNIRFQDGEQVTDQSDRTEA